MITSGSGLERFMSCIGSSVLPRALDARSNEHATRGTELHAYLQRISEGMTPEQSLELVDERFRAAAAAVDVEQLRDILGLTPEMTFAYNPAFGTSRVLGVALEREYAAAGLTEDEIPLTPDLIGLNDPTKPTVGIVVDYKEGWSKRTPVHRNWQMKGAALALARHFDLDEVRVQLVHMREGIVVWRDTATFSASDLAVMEVEVRVRWDLIPGAREIYEQRRQVPEVTRGSWCEYCPSYHACPATMNLVRAAVNRDEMDEFRGGLVDGDTVARAWRMLQDIDGPRRRLKSAIYAAAKERPVLLERLEDGTEVWLGVTEVVGSTKLDGEKARAVVREMLDAEAVDEVSTFEVTMGRIEIACKKRVPKGKGAEKMRAVMKELDRRGGAVKPRKHEVDLYKLKPHQLAAKAG